MINIFSAFLDGLRTPSVFWKAQEIFRDNPDAHWDEIENLLREKMTVLGCGANGVAIKARDGYVLKIFRRNDYGYLAFLDLAIAYDGASNLPKIYWVRDFDNNFLACLIEELECREDAGEHHPDYDEMYYTLAGRDYISKELDEEMLETIALLKAHKKGIDTTMKGHNVYLCEDMHWGNAMIRKNNTLVITDPWCS